jgi:hypothetical protein
MKLYRLFLFIPVFLLLTSTGYAKILAGVELPPVMETSPTALLLNGAGIRTKFFLDLYVGGLYLKQKKSQSQQIIEADETMAIKLHIVSSMITSEKMENATREGFAKATKGNTAPIQTQIEEFIAVFKEEIKENDIYDLVYLTGKGVEVSKNNKLYTTIEGLPFKQALFGIWLGDKPAQGSLKKAMLGQ